MSRLIAIFAKYGTSLLVPIALGCCGLGLYTAPLTLMKWPIPDWMKATGIVAMLALLVGILWLSMNAKFIYREQQVKRLFPMKEWTSEHTRFMAWDIRMNRSNHCPYLPWEETEELKRVLKMYKDYSLEVQRSHMHEINRMYERKRYLTVRRQLVR